MGFVKCEFVFVQFSFLVKIKKKRKSFLDHFISPENPFDQKPPLAVFVFAILNSKKKKKYHFKAICKRIFNIHPRPDLVGLYIKLLQFRHIFKYLQIYFKNINFLIVFNDLKILIFRVYNSVCIKKKFYFIFYYIYPFFFNLNCVK